MQQKAVAHLCCTHGIAQDEEHGQDAHLGISWGYLMEILPLDHGKFSSSPPTKDPVVWWCSVPKAQVMEEPSWSKLEEFGVVPKYLEDTSANAGVVVGPSGATPAVNTGSWRGVWDSLPGEMLLSQQHSACF